MNENIRDDILNRAKASAIKDHAVAGGMRTLRADGLDKVREGESTFEEILRVTGRDEL